MYLSANILNSHQSNNLEYIVLARASRLNAAFSGSRGFVMLPSGVTITLSHNESTRSFSSHLQVLYNHQTYHTNNEIHIDNYMKRCS